MSDTSGAPSGVEIGSAEKGGSRVGGSRVDSSSVAIGTATVFIAIAAVLSFVADDGTTRAPAAWILRGSIATLPPPPPAPGDDRRRVARFDVD